MNCRQDTDRHHDTHSHQDSNRRKPSQPRQYSVWLAIGGLHHSHRDHYCQCCPDN